MEEFVVEYRLLRYGETNKVISYFKSQLDSIGSELSKHEDDLTQYNVDNRIINYYDETKEVAAINKEFELRDQNVRFAYNSSKAMLAELERQMDSNAKLAIQNTDLIDKLRQAPHLQVESQRWKPSLLQTQIPINNCRIIKSNWLRPVRNFKNIESICRRKIQ